MNVFWWIAAGFGLGLAVTAVLVYLYLIGGARRGWRGF